MTKEDIMLAIRLTAQGRYGHPLQEHLADELVKLIERVERAEPKSAEKKPK